MLTPLFVAMLLAAEPEVAAPTSAPPARVMGGVAAPAALPAGTLAVYGQVGAPEVGAGFRQGFSAFELEGRALFNIFEISALVEGAFKLPLVAKDRVAISLPVAVGLKLDSGSRYFDRANFGYVGLRPRVGAVVSYSFSDTIAGLAFIDVPLSLALNVRGAQFTPTIGAGGEFHIGGSISLLVSGHIGVDVTKEPLGVPQTRPAWGARLGVGYRIF